jgi:HEAT repeat protein
MRPVRSRLSWLLGCGMVLFTLGAPPTAWSAEVDDLMARLGSLNAKDRIAAATELQKLGPLAAPAAPALVKAVASDDLVLQYESIVALGLIGPEAAQSPEVVPALEKQLGGRSPLLEHAATHALRMIGPEARAATPKLAQLAANRDPQVFVAAAWALAVVSPRDREDIDPLIPRLVEQLDNPNQDVRNDVVAALAAIGRPAVDALSAEIGVKGPVVCWHAADALAAMGADAEGAVDKLVATLNDKDERVCWHAARALGAIGTDAEKVVPALVAKLDSESKELRVNSALALARFGPDARPAVPKLIGLLNKEDDPNVRVVAVRTLGAIGPGAKAAVPVLNEVLDDEVPGVAFAAVEALGRIGKSSVPVLVQRLKDEDLRMVAATVLGGMGADAVDAVPALLEMNASPDREARVEAMLAIANIGPAAKNAAGPVLTRRLRDEQDDSRAGAIYALVKIGASETAPVIRRVLETDDRRNVQLAAAWALVMFEPNNPVFVKTALPRLRESLTDDWELIRRESLTALGMMGEAALPAAKEIEARLEDSNADVRAEALHALVMIGVEPKQYVGPAIKMLSDENGAVRSEAVFALGTAGPAAAAAGPRLRQMVGDSGDGFFRNVAAWALVRVAPTPENVEVALPPLIETLTKYDVTAARVAAAAALGEVGKGSSEATAALREAATDADAEVAAAAKAALQRIGG